MQKISSSGNDYFTVSSFVDCYSHFIHVFCHKLKSEFPELYLQCNVAAGASPEILCTVADNAGEMMSAAFEQGLLLHGIFHQMSAAFQQWQTGVSE